MIGIYFMIKGLLLFVAIFFSLINTTRIFYKTNIPTINFFLQALGITGLIVYQWLM